MAKFSYNVIGPVAGGTAVQYYIKELGNTWTVPYYMAGGLANPYFQSGVPTFAATLAAGYIHVYDNTPNWRVYGVNNNNPYSAPQPTYEYRGIIVLQSSGTYGPFVADASHGLLWGVDENQSIPQGNIHLGVYIDITSGSAPTPFYWSNYGTAPNDSTAYVFMPKATAWNALNAKIAEWYAYKGMSGYSYTTVSAGTSFLGSYLDNAAGGINTLRGWTYLNFNVNIYQPVFPAARVFYQLQQQLNLVT